MSRIVQEKFQVTSKDPKEDNGNTWITDVQARAKKMMPGREGLAGGDSNSRFETLAAHFNGLPPGMDIEDQEVTDQRRFRFNISGGLGPGGDRTQDLNARALRRGFDKKSCCPTDDQYTGEHVDMFYNEAKVGDDVGFCERGNLLDRL